MIYIHKFLNIDLTVNQDILIHSFIKAIYEIRSEELDMPIDILEKYGDQEAINLIKKSSIQDICLHTDNIKLPENVPKHAKEIIDNYNQLNSVTVFRGTRLPLSHSSFKNGYIHTTPQFATSTAYAVGISNSIGGIGRLLTKEGQRTGLGFIHTYDAPLTTKIYKNFQFEKFTNNKAKDTTITLNDFKKELEIFAALEKKSFEVEYFSEKNLYGSPSQKINMSPNMQKWYNFITSTKCLETPYYEVMLPEEVKAKYTFLIDENTKIIKLNLNNPKIKKVLQKLQNLLMRDFYEIVPLDKLVIDIDLNIAKIENKDNLNDYQNKLLYLVKKESLLLKELRNSVIDMIENIKQNTLLSDYDIEQLMKQSQMVGATNMLGEATLESKIKYSPYIENFIIDIQKKKKLIELPLENFLIVEKMELNSNNNSLITIIDKLIEKIEEKSIPYNLKISEIDTDGVMLEYINNVSKKMNIENKVNPTIDDFIDNLYKIKNQDLVREYCGKPLLIDIYKPMLELIFYKIINKYITVNDQPPENVILQSIQKIRSKFLKFSVKENTNRI